MQQRTGDGVGMTLFGPKGTGKDFMLAVALRRAVLGHGMFARWFNGMDLYVQVRAGMNHYGEVSEAQLIKQLSEIPILAISDPLPPFGSLTEFQSAMLFAILDARYRAKFPTWMTINVLTGKVAADRMGSQILDRIGHSSLPLFCNWGSYREFERGV
jgi:DNA replication protein DnaC